MTVLDLLPGTAIPDVLELLETLARVAEWPVDADGCALHACCEVWRIRSCDVLSIREYERPIDDDRPEQERYFVVELKCSDGGTRYRVELRRREDEDGARWWECERVNGRTG